MIQQTRVSVDEFLAMPEEKPYRELIAGEVVEKSMPGSKHSGAVGELIVDLGSYLRASGEGKLDTELRHANDAEDWVYLPDVSVTLAGRRPRDRGEEPGAIHVPPDFAIEVLSPDDRPGRLSQRVDFYLRTGTQLLWVIDPELELVTVYRPAMAPTLHSAADTIDARPVLRDFHLDLGAYFGRLHA